MRSDERDAVRALMDAVTVAGVAAGVEATVNAWMTVRAAARAVAPFVDAPADDDAQRVHSAEPTTYFLEIKGDPPPAEDIEYGADPDGWECPGCGYESEDLDYALAMLSWPVGEGKPRRIVRMDQVCTLIREVPADFPVQ